jgi:1,4-dihydroxy-2-naphthoyl-CoA hydrolase
MSIWKTTIDVETLNTRMVTHMIRHLGIQFTELGDNYIKASMPVDERTQQPYGLLQGGASVALAETLGSVAASLCIDLSSQRVVGLEINANHIKGVKDGIVIGTVKPVHIGGKTQIWEIHIHNELNQLVCISRITMAVLDHKAN